MEKLYLTIAISFFLIGKTHAQTNPGYILADKFAQRMKDSLHLSNEQKQQLYNLNIQIQNMKTAVWQQYAGADSLRILLQSAENKRDSLYRAVLNDQQFQKYRLQKRNLITNR